MTNDEEPQQDDPETGRRDVFGRSFTRALSEEEVAEFYEVSKGYAEMVRHKMTNDLNIPRELLSSDTNFSSTRSDSWAYGPTPGRCASEL